MPNNHYEELQALADVAGLTVTQYTERVMIAHVVSERLKARPTPKVAIPAMLERIESGTLFVVTDVMPDELKNDPASRRYYGQQLTLMVARNTISALFTNLKQGTLTVYRKK